MKEKKQQEIKTAQLSQQDLQLKEYKLKLEEYTNDLKRLQAEFENYKKRIEKENNFFLEYSNARLISKLLAVLDDFDSCIKNISHSDEHTKGIFMLHQKILKILQEEGLREVETKIFDPYKHEVLFSVESERPDGEVLEVIQKGYILKDRVIRHAKVKISKHKEEKKNDA